MKKLINDKLFGNGMRKFSLVLLLLLLVPFNSAFANLFIRPIVFQPDLSYPETTMNFITLERIDIDGYGDIDDDNSTPSVFHFQIPLMQNYKDIYFTVGYLPLCDANQSDYVHDITLYCGNNEYINSWNITDNCVNNGGVYEYEWLNLRLENLTETVFQSEKSSLYSCMFYVNDTSTINRTDFWIRIENYGNKVVNVVNNQTVLLGSTIIEDTFGKAVELTGIVLSYALIIVPLFLIISSFFVILFYLLFMIRRLIVNIKSSIPKF